LTPTKKPTKPSQKMKLETQQAIRRHIRKLGYSDSRRSRAGEWFTKSSPRYENNWKPKWETHPLFKNDEEAVESLRFP
jgi:hypothetical protein